MPTRIRTHRPAFAAANAGHRLRPSSTSRGYGRRWRRLRDHHLNGSPLCVACGLAGRTTAATEVDHVVPVRAGGGMFDRDNLQSLCKRCHSKKTAATDGGFGRPRGG